MNDTLQRQLAEREWFYEYDLPGGLVAPCRTPAHVAPIHTTRLEMLWRALDAHVEARGGWSQQSVIDIACHQGYYSVQLARRGARKVLGIDARADHVADAELIRQAYGLENARFERHDIYETKAEALGRFDIVVCYGLLYHVEHPVGLLRLCRQLLGAGGACVVETQVVPNLSGNVDWGSYEYVKPLMGVMGLVDESEELDVPEASTTGICMAPSLEGLLWMMRKVGFTRVVQVPPPDGGYEQHRFGKRVVVAGYA